MKWATPIELFVKIAVALWLIHIISPSQKEVQTLQRLRESKPLEAATA
jgi:hypothetical protein